MARFCRLSAPGPAALSLWRLEGTAEEIARALDLASLPPLDRPRLIALPAASGGVLDQALLWLRETKEAQGKEQVEVKMKGIIAELHVHGGYGIAAGLRARLAACSWSEYQAPASPDELRLWAARAPLNARVAAELVEGGFERRLDEIQRLPAEQRRARLDELLAWCDWAEVLERPPAVVLAGPPNAGKSTLFNAWLQEERVTVSPYPGTTRDAVQAGILLGEGRDAWEALLVDTAGLWPEARGVDAEAAAATRSRLAQAWRVIWLFDAATRPAAGAWQVLQEAARPGDLFVLHRADLVGAWEPGDGRRWRRASVQKEGLALIRELERQLVAQLGPPPPPGLPLPLGAERRAALHALRGES